jgi:hypothetical protein
MPFSLLRLAAVSLIVFLRIRISNEDYDYIYFSFLFGHYLLALIYSRARLKRRASSVSGLIYFGLFLILAVFAAYYQIPNMILYSAVHHVLSETLIPSSLEKRALWPRGFLEFFIYLSILNYTMPFHWISPDLVLAALTLSYLATLASLMRGIKTRWAHVLDLILFETFGFAAAVTIPLGYVRLQDVIFYHVLFWVVFPLTQRIRENAFLWRYVLGTACATLFFWILTPMAGFLSGETQKWYDGAFFFGSLHISLSFLLSRWNPDWRNLLGGRVST